jgi:hypothetical protein
MTEPPKGKRARQGPNPLIQDDQRQHTELEIEGQSGCDSWAAEGRRLLRLYQRFGTARHYRAYLVHCAGIGSHVVGKGGLQ